MNKAIILLVAMFFVIGAIGVAMACPEGHSNHGHHNGHHHERNPHYEQQPPTGGEVPGGEVPPTSPE